MPGLAVGTVVEYCLSASDLSGRTETLPRTAPGGFYSFTVNPGLGLSGSFSLRRSPVSPRLQTRSKPL